MAEGTLLLARHGETDDNAAFRFQGTRNPPLNETGRAQAAALGEHLAGSGVVVVWSSPLARARETAEIVGAAIGLAPRFDERLVEIDVGDWTGRSYAEVFAEFPDELLRWRGGDKAFRFPGGESVGEQELRVVEVLEEIRAAGELPALVVCHGGVIRVAMDALAGGVDPSDAVGNGTVRAL